MIQLQNINRTFGRKTVLKNLNIEIHPQRITAITGPSGSGKTTLLNIIGLLDDAFTGSLKIHQIDMKSMSKRAKNKFIRQEISYLFQNYALVDNETVHYNLRLVTKNENDMIKALEKVNLSQDILKTPVYILSGGEQQRVALARAILKGGSIILADEPTGNLDDDNTKIVMQVMQSLAQEGKTVILVTHNNHIVTLCDDVIVLE